MGEGAIGIDIGGTSVRVGEGRPDGDVALISKFETPPTFDLLTGELLAVLAPVLGAGGAHTPVGVGVPGAVRADGSTWVPNVPYLSHPNLPAGLRSALGAAVVVANDAQMALLGEAVHGAARDHRDVVLVTFGTGVGGATMHDGRVVRGVHGATGAFGWFGCDPHAAGRDHGPLEARASGHALQRAAAGTHSIAGWGTSAVQASRNEAVSEEQLLRKAAEAAGHAIGSLVSMLDPGLLVIGGGLGMRFADCSDVLLDAVKTCASPIGREVPAVWSELADLGGMIGAVEAATKGRQAWL